MHQHEEWNAFLQQLTEERKTAIEKLRQTIENNLPAGFTNWFEKGMLHFVVPHSIYPKGYHCKPKQPLYFISLAAQKNYIAVYHMGLYADEKLFNWFKAEWVKLGMAKPDIGKSCIRFKKYDQIPFDLIGELSGKLTPQQWINQYEALIKK